MTIATEHLTRALEEIREAVRNNEITVAFQPQLDLTSEELQGVEALARWKHPVRGMIPPGIFITLAEQDLSTIRQLTLSISRQLFEHDLLFQSRGLKIRLSLNLSAVLLDDESFPEELQRLIDYYGFEPSRLTVEITETARAGDAKTCRRSLARLREIGVELSMDDFGVGFSSFTQLYHTPFRELKLDKSFVQDASGNYAAATVVRNLISLGHQLGMKVVAEGVEDEGTHSWLCELGCDVGQGYLYAAPMPAERILGWQFQRAAAQAA